ncbi:platelet-derived growth factor receptor-like protein isoform X2 [Esox lucius]|uniref:platelet-derived growth factor receptor-like protein isoform X2 n=1 Tax=Esox lucius TaxID=8010 RepID=UPI001476D562|nr:platelet-derived growth factor receptor-like protein isoform X2 [Esox lucius]
MKLRLVLLTLAILWEELQNGACQQVKRRKEAGENRIRPGSKRVKVRYPKVKEKDTVGRGQSILTQVLDKGRFLRLGENVSLTPGKDIELRCKGTNIGWSYPTYLDTFNDSRLSIKQSDKYGQLILTSPSAADTGTYSCWVILCDGSECLKDPDHISSTYIFFTDKDNLFVPSAIYFEIVYLRPDRPSVIPCRVTSPLAKVSLHRVVPPEEMEVDGTLVTYHPTKGFILQKPSPEHQGVFYCMAVTKAPPQISNKYQLLYVEVPSSPPYVTIEASLSSASGGDNINITCTVLGEPDVDISFTWTYPGQGLRPVSVRDSWRLINRGIAHTTRISQSVMAVDDLETIDFGKYICRAKNKNGETAVATSVRAN